jgi:hypothetical protein
MHTNTNTNTPTHSTDDRLEALQALEDLNYQLDYDMDGSAFFTLDNKYQEYDDLPPHVQNLIAIYFADAETYTDLPNVITN